MCKQIIYGRDHVTDGRDKDIYWFFFRRGKRGINICANESFCFVFFFFPPLDASAGNGILTKATVPIYATGVLTCYNQVTH